MANDSGKWSAERVSAWKAVRARGRGHFIWTHGVLRWGGFMFGMSFAIYQYRVFGGILSAEGNLPFRLLFAAAVWIYVGYLYGRATWHRNEREYARQMPGSPFSMEI